MYKDNFDFMTCSEYATNQSYTKEKLMKIIPRKNFFAIGNKYIRQKEKYEEDLGELRGIIKLIRESPALIMSNLLTEGMVNQKEESK